MVGEIQGPFDIAVQSFGVVSELKDSEPQFGALPAKATDYFAFDVDLSGAGGKKAGFPIEITVDVLAGTPDLFISTTSYTPGPTNFIWRRLYTGSNYTVRISPEDKNYVSQGTYAIAVLAYGVATDFYVQATVDRSGTFAYPLTDGEAIFGSVDPHAMRYFMFNATDLTKNSGVQFEASPFTGGPLDLYISNTGAGNQPVFPRVQCIKWSGSTGACAGWTVDNSTYHFSNTGSSGGALVSIPFKDFNHDTLFIVGVYGNSMAGSVFTVKGTELGPKPLPSPSVAPTNAPMPGGALVNGKPARGIVNSWETPALMYYTYKLVAPQGATDFTFEISAENIVGQVTIYASDVMVHPTSSATWKATLNFEMAYLSVSSTQLTTACKTAATTGVGCNIYIAVTPVYALFASEYSILAFVSSDVQSPMRPESGDNAPFYAVKAVPYYVQGTIAYQSP